MNSVLVDTVLTKVYPLNSSKSKFAIVGLRQNQVGKWCPRVCFTGPFWSGVRLTDREFDLLAGQTKHITRYFDDNNFAPKEKIQLDAGTAVSFVAAYNKKAINIESDDCK